MITICLTIIGLCLAALAVTLTVHYTTARRDAYWQGRAERLADILAEKQFRELGAVERLNQIKRELVATPISSQGKDRASAVGSIEVETELASATWMRG